MYAQLRGMGKRATQSSIAAVGWRGIVNGDDYSAVWIDGCMDAWEYVWIDGNMYAWEYVCKEESTSCMD